MDFAAILVGIAEGMSPRINALHSAVDRYLSSCDHDYTVDLSGAPVGLGGWGIALHDLGDWTRGVAATFLLADAIPLYTGMGGVNQDAVMTLPDTQVIAGLPARFASEPYLGVASSGEIDWAHTNLASQWLSEVSKGLSGADLSNGPLKTAGEVWQKGLQTEGVLTHTPVSSLTEQAGAFNDLDKVLGSAVSFAAGFAGQWDKDEGLPEGTKVLQSLGRGVTDAVSFEGGFAVGTALTVPALGPAAPLAGLALGTLASLGAGAVFDHLVPGPSVAQRISASNVTTQEMAQTRMNAENQASADSNNNPARQAQIQADAAKGRQQLEYDAGVAGPPGTVPPASPPPGS
ncbi:MAG: hypothetical protein ACR2MN_05615 [Acidimicrobiales bacterium]